MYVTIDKLIPELTDEHFTLDEKTRNVTFTDEGNEFLEERLHAAGCCPRDSRFTIRNRTTIVHHVNQGLRRTSCSKGQRLHRPRRRVVLIDEFTGRMMPGGACQTVCIRRSKPRKACRSSPRTSRWRP